MHAEGSCTPLSLRPRLLAHLYTPKEGSCTPLSLRLRPGCRLKPPSYPPEGPGNRAAHLRAFTHYVNI